MKKEKWIDFHQFLAEVEKQAGAWGDDLNTPNYDSLEVRPIDVHKLKREHRKAVFALADDITSSILDEFYEILEEYAEPLETPYDAKTVELSPDIMEELGPRYDEILDSMERVKPKEGPYEEGSHIYLTDGPENSHGKVSGKS